MQNTDIRCGQCRRKLGEGVYTRLAIKCPRCRALNPITAQSPAPHAGERPTEEKDAYVSPQTTIPNP